MPLTTVGGMTLAARWTGLGAVLLIVVGLAACAPEPAPSPTPTGFASEEEAFAAAEATYRAYVEALNGVNLADPASFDAVYELTSEDARNSIAKELSRMHADGWSVSGETRITTIRLADWHDRVAKLAVCADVSGVTLKNAAGESMVSSNRPPVQSLLVEVSEADGRAAITSLVGRDGDPTC